MRDPFSGTPLIVGAVQTQLSDYWDGIPAVGTVARARLYPGAEVEHPEVSLPKLALGATGVIELAWPFCPHCGHKLAKWGVNPRTLILDKGHAPAVNGIQRYRCEVHGEISVDLGAWVPNGATYADNFRRRACRLVGHGHTPADVREIFLDCYDRSPSVSSIRTWAREAAIEAGAVIRTTSIPTSGFFGYDEIHLRVNGQKGYALTMADLHTGFCPPADYSPSINRSAVKAYFNGIKHVLVDPMAGLVVDGAINFGDLFRTRGFDQITVQRCQTHYKKNLNEKIYEAAGMGKKLKDPLPPPYDRVKRELFVPFKRSTGLRAEIQLVVADGRLRGKVSPAVDALLDDLVAHAPALFQYHYETRLQRTNNRDECWNSELERYPSLKTRMKTAAGVRRVLDAATFLHNWDAFTAYIKEMEAKNEKLRAFVKQDPRNADLKPELQGATVHLRYVRQWQARYAEVYNRHYMILQDPY